MVSPSRALEPLDPPPSIPHLSESLVMLPIYRTILIGLKAFIWLCKKKHVVSYHMTFYTICQFCPSENMLQFLSDISWELHHEDFHSVDPHPTSKIFGNCNIRHWAWTWIKFGSLTRANEINIDDGCKWQRKDPVPVPKLALSVITASVRVPQRLPYEKEI